MAQTKKKALRAGHESGFSLEQSLASFLLRYCTTPHTTTGVMSCSLFVGRDLRTRLHLVSPDIGAHIRDKLIQQNGYHDRHSCARELNIGQPVRVRNFREGPSWVPAVVSDHIGPVSDCIGPVSYLVQLKDGDLWCHHINHPRVDHDAPPARGTLLKWKSSLLFLGLPLSLQMTLRGLP